MNPSGSQDTDVRQAPCKKSERSLVLKFKTGGRYSYQDKSRFYTQETWVWSDKRQPGGCCATEGQPGSCLQQTAAAGPLHRLQLTSDARRFFLIEISWEPWFGWNDRVILILHYDRPSIYKSSGLITATYITCTGWPKRFCANVWAYSLWLMFGRWWSDEEKIHYAFSTHSMNQPNGIRILFIFELIIIVTQLTASLKIHLMCFKMYSLFKTARSEGLFSLQGSLNLSRPSQNLCACQCTIYH